jgi:hypothetical protein
VHSLTVKLKFFESIFGTGQLAANGKNFGIRCPFCAHKDPNKRKLVIRVEDDVVHCWVCGWKAHSMAPLIRKFGSQTQLLRYRDEFMPEEAKHSWRTYDDVTEQEKQKLVLPKDFKLLTLASLADPDVKAAWFYLKKRRISLRDAWYFKFGVSNEMRWKRRIIMPSFDESGELNYFVARNVYDNDPRPKYDNPPDDKLPIIFNEINVDWNKRLVLCEGPFDLVKCGDNAVPLLGSDLNEESRLFSQILLYNTSVAVALDADMWQTKTPRLVKKLQEYSVDVSLVDVREWGDPGKMTKQQFRQALETAIVPTWTSSFLEKLSRVSDVRLSMKRDRWTNHAS